MVASLPRFRTHQHDWLKVSSMGGAQTAADSRNVAGRLLDNEDAAPYLLAPGRLLQVEVA
jgi:hypothetical protein